jgi:hypothetical protein
MLLICEGSGTEEEVCVSFFSFSHGSPGAKVELVDTAPVPPVRSVAPPCTLGQQRLISLVAR